MRLSGANRHAFTTPDLWLPNSHENHETQLDISADYKIWSQFSNKSAKNADLGQRLTDIWAGLEQTVIDDAIDQWHRRLCAYIRARGRHSDYSL